VPRPEHRPGDGSGRAKKIYCVPEGNRRALTSASPCSGPALPARNRSCDARHQARRDPRDRGRIGIGQIIDRPSTHWACRLRTAASRSRGKKTSASAKAMNRAYRRAVQNRLPAPGFPRSIRARNGGGHVGPSASALWRRWSPRSPALLEEVRLPASYAGR